MNARTGSASEGFGRDPGTEPQDQGQSGIEDKTPTSGRVSLSRKSMATAITAAEGQPQSRVDNSFASENVPVQHEPLAIEHLHASALGISLDVRELSPDDARRTVAVLITELGKLSAEFTRLGGRLHDLEESQDEIRALVEVLQREIKQSGTAVELDLQRIRMRSKALEDRLEATRLEQIRSNARIFSMQHYVRRVVSTALVLAAIGITVGAWSPVARWMEAQKRSRITRRFEPGRLEDQPVIFAIPAMVPPNPDEDTEDKDKEEEGYEEPVNGFKVRKNVVEKLRKLHGLDQAEQLIESDNTEPDSEPTLDSSRYPTRHKGPHLPPRPGITDTCIRLGNEFYVVESEGGHYRFTIGTDERIAKLNLDGSVEWKYPHDLPTIIRDQLGETLAGNDIPPITPISREEWTRIIEATSVSIDYDGYSYYILFSSFENESFRLKRRQLRFEYGRNKSASQEVELDDATLQKLQEIVNQRVRSARILYVSEPPKEPVQEHSQELGESKGEPFKDVPSEWYPERKSSPESGSTQAETPPPSQERAQAEPDVKPSAEYPPQPDPPDFVKRLKKLLVEVGQSKPEATVVTSSVALRQRLCARPVTVRDTSGKKTDYFLTAEDIEVLSNGRVRVKPNVQVWRRGEDLHGVGPCIIEAGSDLVGDLGDILSDRAAEEMAGKQDGKTP